MQYLKLDLCDRQPMDDRDWCDQPKYVTEFFFEWKLELVPIIIILYAYRLFFLLFRDLFTKAKKSKNFWFYNIETAGDVTVSEWTKCSAQSNSRP